MSKLSERIRANRDGRDRQSIEVEEWGEDGTPLQLYFGPVTGRDIDRVQRKHNDFLTNPTMASMVDMIIIKAEDTEGEKLFTIEDKQVLLGEPISTIGNVFGAVFNATSIEEQEKN